MTTETQVGTFKTGNTTWTVRVAHHIFYASAPGFADVHGETWDAMENNAKVQASKAKIRVAVPYVIMRWVKGKPAFTRRVATGLHSANGNVLYTDGGSPGQETGYESKYRPFSPEDEAAYLDLVQRSHDIGSQIREFDKKYAFDKGLKGAVQEAIDAEHARRAGAEATA